jgi:hypothetical protein
VSATERVDAFVLSPSSLRALVLPQLPELALSQQTTDAAATSPTTRDDVSDANGSKADKRASDDKSSSGDDAVADLDDVVGVDNAHADATNVGAPSDAHVDVADSDSKSRRGMSHSLVSWCVRDDVSLTVRKRMTTMMTTTTTTTLFCTSPNVVAHRLYNRHR